MKIFMQYEFFILTIRKSVYYLMSGSTVKLQKFRGAQNLIHWEAIEYYYDKVIYFDFEGSMIENIESNFRKFGGTQNNIFIYMTKVY